MIGSLFSRLWDALGRALRAIFSPTALIAAPRRLMGLSLPTRVALMTFLFLVVAVITAIVVRWFDPQHPYLANFTTPKWIAVTAILLIAIPLFAYWTVKLWLEGEPSAWPDIDIAWSRGMQALAEHGVDIHTTPLFLILGPRDEKEVQSLFDAAQLNLLVRTTPAEFAALHWGATSDAIYLVCTTANCLSELARRGADSPLASGAPAAQATGDGLRGTMIVGASAPAAELATLPDVAAAAATPEFRGTMVIGAEPGQTFSPEAVGRRSEATVAQLPKAEVNKQRARLEYVCQLLHKARQPVCPANGVLTVLPFSLMQHSDAAAVALRYAAQNDLETLLHGLRLRCPVVALVGEMETEPGFQELVRRVGPARAKAQRFGKGFNVWNPPLAEQVEAVSTHACGAFEDFTYALFREPGGLQKVRGNKQLYALLCKVRQRLRHRLEDILVNAYGYEGDLKASPPEKLLFGGCYFAATGEREDQQAFVKNVFEKLLQEESELDWTEAALAEDDRYQRWANAALGVALLAGMSIAGILVYRFSGWFDQ